MVKELYELGEQPPLGVVPAKMHAWLVRPERFGEPNTAFAREVVDVPDIAPDEVLVWVMAAGVNYNNVWAALGVPIDVIAARNKAGEPEPFHIGGSDASGIVYKIGSQVKNVKVGDEVVIHCGTWSGDCPHVRAGYDPMYSPTFRIWGYETNYGSFAQFTRVQAHQCLPRPRHLSWEGSAAYMLVGATAYRMLLGWDEHQVMKDDVVLIWGGAGGLGSMAIQIVKARGGIPIAVISSEEKRDFCMSLGAKGCINRKDFAHWGMLPHWKDNAGYREWLKGARDFGKAIWDVLGERRNPRIVFEHPGESTIPSSIFVCDTGGMVVICAGTTGYNATVDLRYLWMRQKRLQGSHFANDDQSHGVNQMVLEGLVDPCLSETYRFDDLPSAHQLMYENRHPHGNMAILVNALELGSGIASDVRGRAPIPVPSGERDQRAVHYTAPTPALDDGEELPDAITDGKKVRDFMTEGLLSCAPADTVGYAATMMVQNHVHAIVVLRDGLAVGVVTQTDLVMARQNYRRDELLAMPVERIMTSNCETVEIDVSVSDAISRMTRQRIHRLVVVDDNRAVGILSMSDIVAQMVTNWPPKLPDKYTRS